MIDIRMEYGAIIIIMMSAQIISSQKKICSEPPGTILEHSHSDG